MLLLPYQLARALGVDSDAIVHVRKLFADLVIGFILAFLVVSSKSCNLTLLFLYLFHDPCQNLHLAVEV